MSSERTGWALAAALLIASGCGDSGGDGSGSTAISAHSETPPAHSPATAPDPAPADGRVTVTARDYTFSLPDPLLSGWTSFQFFNHGEEPHFFILWKLPAGKTIQDYFDDIVPAFVAGWKAILEGATQVEANARIAESFPDWFPRAMGGIGMVSPGETARTTVRLDPGDYVMECYVRTAEGKFHSELGMIRPLTVKEEATTAGEPAADLELTVANGRIDVAGDPSAGPRTVAARFTEHPPAGLGNDVHLVRLDDGADLDAIARWMNWLNREGLQAPAPARFVGGTQEVPAGATAYFEVDLEPGRYAWIMEQPDARDSLVEFEVAALAK